MQKNSFHFAPPDDTHFQSLMLRASRGQISVYGVVIETNKVDIVRSFDSFRPEEMEGSIEVIDGMFDAWNAGQTVQPWLYAKDGKYVVADDYFWLALIEKGRPNTIAAQILGEPLALGLIERTGPLSIDKIQSMIGKL
jgi:hypothetical protein